MQYMYRIGTEWLFDEDTKQGFKVIKEDNTEQVKELIKAFRIEVSGTEIKCVAEENYTIDDIPFGVIRKASHLIELQKSGELKRYEREASKST